MPHIRINHLQVELDIEAGSIGQAINQVLAPIFDRPPGPTMISAPPADPLSVRADDPRLVPALPAPEKPRKKPGRKPGRKPSEHHGDTENTEPSQAAADPAESLTVERVYHTMHGLGYMKLKAIASRLRVGKQALYMLLRSNPERFVQSPNKREWSTKTVSTALAHNP